MHHAEREEVNHRSLSPLRSPGRLGYSNVQQKPRFSFHTHTTGPLPGGKPMTTTYQQEQPHMAERTVSRDDIMSVIDSNVKKWSTATPQRSVTAQQTPPTKRSVHTPQTPASASRQMRTPVQEDVPAVQEERERTAEDRSVSPSVPSSSSTQPLPGERRRGGGGGGGGMNTQTTTNSSHTVANDDWRRTAIVGPRRAVYCHFSHTSAPVFGPEGITDPDFGSLHPQHAAAVPPRLPSFSQGMQQSVQRSFPRMRRGGGGGGGGGSKDNEVFCTGCGAAVQKKDKFCRDCGEVQGKGVGSSASSPRSSHNNVASQHEMEQQQQQHQQSQQQQPRQEPSLPQHSLSPSPRQAYYEDAENYSPQNDREGSTSSHLVPINPSRGFQGNGVYPEPYGVGLDGERLYTEQEVQNRVARIVTESGGDIAPLSALEMALSQDRSSPRTARRVEGIHGVVLEMPNDRVPVVPLEAQTTRAQLWRHHPASVVITSLLALRGVHHESHPELVDRHMTRPFLDAMARMMSGAYFLHFSRDAATRERWCTISMLQNNLDPTLGALPHFCLASHAHSTGYKERYCLSELVGVQKDNCSPGFQPSLLNKDYIYSPSMTNRKQPVLAKNCFTLWFLTAKGVPHHVDLLNQHVCSVFFSLLCEE